MPGDPAAFCNSFFIIPIPLLIVIVGQIGLRLCNCSTRERQAYHADDGDETADK